MRNGNSRDAAVVLESCQEQNDQEYLQHFLLKIDQLSDEI